MKNSYKKYILGNVREEFNSTWETLDLSLYYSFCSENRFGVFHHQKLKGNPRYDQLVREVHNELRILDPSEAREWFLNHLKRVQFYCEAASEY